MATPFLIGNRYSYKHGHGAPGKESATYRSWRSMLNRCSLRPKNYVRDRYVMRGITVCERWLKFENFLADMGERPKGKSLDRVNNDGNYEPSNCRWATRKEQQRNMRTNHLVTFNGQTLCLTAWAELLGWSVDVIKGRFRYGWPIERALSEPPHR